MHENRMYLVADTDRHGNRRLYVRRSGRKIRIRERIGSQAFAAAYERAVERLFEPHATHQG
jgi:hypothetical protein